MINNDTMNLLNSYGFGADIDGFETHISLLRDAAGLGKPMVDDATYDMYIRLLRELKPDSVIFQQNWETEEEELDSYDEILKEYGMCSITTLQDMSEVAKFNENIKGEPNGIDLFCSVKENGHAFRAVYLNGTIYNGTTRGRYKKGRSIPRHVRATCPNYVEAWKNIPLVEVRGEMLVKISTFEKYLKNILKTPLSSVTSLIRESATDEELKLLNAVCYKVISNDNSLVFDSLWDEFQHLKACGFEVPQHILVRGVHYGEAEQAVGEMLQYFEGLMDKNEIEYSCDGLVFAINDNKKFYSLGKNGNAWNGNFALKAGRYWESNVYSSTIRSIAFIPGKSYMTPKANIDPVICSTGAEIKVVPLYNVGVMERYGYTPGNTVYFRFGGETGVTLCDMYGDSVKQ